MEALLEELKKIKAIDPNLETFKQIYRNNQAYQGNLQREETKEMNEIDILMEILSIGDKNLT